MADSHTHEDSLGQRSPRVKLDLTVNVPTILTLCAMTITAITAGIRVYNDLDARTTRNAYELSTLRDRVVAAEASMVTLKQETGTTAQALRAEIKQDLSEIKSTLNDLAFGRRGAPQPREWSR
jgi:hypothetical protein